MVKSFFAVSEIRDPYLAFIQWRESNRIRVGSSLITWCYWNNQFSAGESKD
jgi:hypothetical protein